jgi:hypothetical protein
VLIANNQLKLFAVLLGIVFALIALQLTQHITVFLELANLFCSMIIIVSFAKHMLTFYKKFLAFSNQKYCISLLFSYIVFQHTQKLIFSDLSNEIANSNTAYMIMNATV